MLTNICVLLACLAAAGGSKLDPTLFTAAYKRNRFYMFTRREPADLIELKA